MDPLTAARLAMVQGKPNAAVEILDNVLTQMPPNVPSHHRLLCLIERADALWAMGLLTEAVESMMVVLKMHSQTLDERTAEDIARRWRSRYNDLFQRKLFPAAEKSCFIALFFLPKQQFYDTERADMHAAMAFAKYQQFNSSYIDDIKQCKTYSIEVAKEWAQRWKQEAIHFFTKLNGLEDAIRLFDFCLEHHPEDGSYRDHKQSVLSYKAAVHFRLGQFKRTLEIGNECYNTKPTEWLKEAERWKERGRILSVKEKRYDLLPECYRIAIKFAPLQDKELLATLYSNRSLAFKRQEKWKEALEDGQKCVELKPNWSKAHYRLGSSLFAMERNSKAMDAFCRALHLSTEGEHYETLMQIIAVSHKLPDCTTRVAFQVPRDVVQKAVNACIDEENWSNLYVLFLGGGGAKKSKQHVGGLATGCDTSAVRLEQVIRVDNVPDLEKFVSTLLKHKTPAFHIDKTRQQPLAVALERKKFGVAELLRQKETGVGEVQDSSQSLCDEGTAEKLAQNAVEQLQKNNLTEAIRLLNAAKSSACTGALRYKILKYLAEAEFKQGNYDKCLKAGREMHSESEALAIMWKDWGNELLKMENFNCMVEFYDLAIKFLPGSNTELRAVILSNRSMAHIRRKAYAKAQKDAKECIKTRPKWFRGYYRLGACLVGSKQHDEALQEYCRSYEHAQNDKEKKVAAHEIVSTAMICQDGASKIKCKISPQILNMVIKEVVRNGELKLLRYLFLGAREQWSASSKAGPLASNCDASCVPLDLLLQIDVNDQEKLLETLLKQGALCDGVPKRGVIPLQVALEEENYAFAVALLKGGADPSCVVGPSTFIRGQGTPSQWLKLGRKAMETQNYKKVVMFMCLCLEVAERSKEKFVSYECHDSLSKAYFQMGNPIKCLQAGSECFKLKSNKSEGEAIKWKFRGSKLYEQNLFSSSVECFNMAANYAPVNNEKLLGEVLYNRSKARQKNNDFHGALKDAKSAAKFQPELLKGHLNLLECYKMLRRDKEALMIINECIMRNPQHEVQYDLLSDGISIASRLKGDTTAITADIPSTIVTKLIGEVVKTKDWKKLGILYLGGVGRESYPVGGGGLASGCDTSTVPIEEIISSSLPNRFALVSALLKDGAHGSGLGGGNSIVVPLAVAIQERDLALVEDLVKHEADPCALTADGQTPLHEALRIGNSEGKFQFLKALLKSNHKGIRDVQNSEGSTLYHYTTSGKCTQHKCEAIRTLRDAKINPLLPNKRGKLAIDCVKPRDSRWKMLKSAMDCLDSAQIPRLAKSDTDLEDLVDGKKSFEVPDAAFDKVLDGAPISKAVIKPKATDINVIQQKKPLDNTWKRVQTLIDNLVVEKILQIEETEEDDMERETNATKNQQEAVPHLENKLPEEMKEVVTKQENTDEVEETEEADVYEIINSSVFENLPWEVDCTDDVWRILRSDRIDEATKRRIVSKIQVLADGRWSKTMCKRLEGPAKQQGILLYETKLTKGARILWEKTIAFSARCSQDAQFRVLKGQGKGLIYSEIIRVWDVVLDHNALDRRINKIIKSHRRGLSCIIKKDLKGIKRDDQRNDTSTKECLPNYYVTKAEDNQQSNSTELAVKHRAESLPGQDEVANIFFPPASPNDQEYHILKFYTFGTALVRTILEGDSAKRVDFPFKATEREDAIIRLRQKPPCPVILIGRSGTGKTTCCLYRLWSEFQTYWEGAATGGPHMPKYKESEIEEKEEIQTSDSGAQENVVHIEIESENNEETAAAISDCENAFGSSDSFEHLHQLFITKNSVLCSEVQKTFRELFHACPSVLEHTRMEDHALPGRIQDVEETAWPLFINSRNWLLLLDASLPGEPFFKRNPDGSLSRRIEGWGEEDNHLQYIPADDSDDDEDNEEDKDENQDKTEHGEESGRSKQTPPKEVDPRREITYQVFKQDIWPKMGKKAKGSVEYHPTLVWTEIRSFIKGSAKALRSENGVLSLEDYHNLGKKMAPNFSADLREDVYRLFEIYERVRSNLRMFDEADLIFNLHHRLQAIPAPQWSVHRLYVDETQDFSQSELSLLIRCCRHPNDIFFTGDTAQSIMRGIAFRFEDLKSLFFYANEEAVARGHRDLIRVPDRLFQLTHNYRSHSGILRLASSVVDLLLNYFPESFDRLEKDQGMFDGPRPVLLESCNLTDLAMIMRGNRRQTSRIEFGAHQAILVASDEARDALPDELKHGLVMTIYEAKGLEFDDVLIYNFFKDSQANKEWRVVTAFLKERYVEQTRHNTGLVEISEESLRAKSRPLEFDSEKHRVLNSEFKNLYTAITRARVNVWFFDEDKMTRAPMFEYFQMLGLVEVVSRENEEEGQEPLTPMFAEKSTTAEWKERGMFFYKKRLWEVAIKCFKFAGDELMVQKSQAHLQASEARRWSSENRSRMREEFLKAAEMFIDCKMVEEAEVCLYNAREWLLLAQLYEKTEKFADAAKYFTKVNYFEKASVCFEHINNYHQAVEILCRAKRFEKAIDVLERYNTLATEGAGAMGVTPPRSIRTVERLCFSLASEYYKNGEYDEMKDVLQRLPSAEDRIDFLKKHGFVDAAVRAMVEDGKRKEAATLLQTHGKFQEAIAYCEDPLFVAKCLVSAVRTASIDKSAIPGKLIKAQELYRQCEENDGQAEALVMLGRSERNMKRLKEAGKLFNKTGNVCGACESIEAMFEIENGTSLPLPPWITVRAIERLVSLIDTLCRPKEQLKMVEEKMLVVCEKHFGLLKWDVRFRLCNKRSGCRFSEIAPDLVRGNSSDVDVVVDVTTGRQRISKHLMDLAISLICQTRKRLEAVFLENSICKEHLNGFTCVTSDCQYLHSSDDSELFSKRFTALLNLVCLEAVKGDLADVMKQHQLGTHHSEIHPSAVPRSCERFYDLLFPATGLRSNKLTRHFRDLKRYPAFRKRLRSYAQLVWNSSERLSDVDSFLKASFILELAEDLSTMMTFLSQEEAKMKHVEANAADATRTRNALVENRSYFRCWQDGRLRLHRQGKVLDAAHQIVRRFLSLPAKRTGVRFPSITNTVLILEYQLTVCLALFARLKSPAHQVPICLPECYLAAVQLWDNLRCTTKGHRTLYEAVEQQASSSDSRKLISQVQSQLNYMVDLTCGQTSNRFDVVHDALQDERSKPEDAERTLVLAMTMLCNCGSAIRFVCDTVLLKSLWKISLRDTTSNRVRNALVAVKNASGVRDVVIALKTLLQSRNEKLFDIDWLDHKLRCDASRNSNPSRYPTTFHADLMFLRGDAQVIEEKNNTEILEEVQEPALGLSVEFDEELERKEREKVELDLRSKAEMESQEVLKSGTEESIHVDGYVKSSISEDEAKDSASRSLDEHFTSFEFDLSACGICGEDFTKLLDIEDYNPEIESDGPQEIQRSAEDLAAAQQKCFHEHANSPAHDQRMTEFMSYKKLYKEHLAPLLIKEERLHNELQESTSVGLDLQRLNTASQQLQGQIGTLESKKTWCEAHSLQKAITQLEQVVQEVEQILHQVNKDKEGSLVEEGAELGSHEHDDDTHPLKEVPKPEKTKMRPPKAGKRKRR